MYMFVHSRQFLDIQAAMSILHNMHKNINTDGWYSYKGGIGSEKYSYWAPQSDVVVLDLT